MLNKKILYYLLSILIVCSFIFLSFKAATKESLTFDEIVYQEEGRNNLEFQKFNVDPYNPPLIRELQYLPVFLGLQNNESFPNLRALYPRMVSVLFAVIVLIAVMQYAHKYFGKKSALFSGLLLSLEPTFLAHGHYITPDMGLTCFVFLTYLSFYRILAVPSWSNFFYFGVFFGMAAAAKVAAIPFVLFSVIIFFVLKRKVYTLDWHVSHLFKTSFAYLASAFVIWASYFFISTPIIVKHDNPERVSNKIIAFANERQLDLVAQGISLLQNTPVPLGNYLGILKNNVLRATKDSQVFYMGSFFESVKLYMIPITLIFKLPLPLIIFFILGVAMLLFPNLGERKQRNEQDVKSYDSIRQVPLYKLKIHVLEKGNVDQRAYLLIPIMVIILSTVILRFSPLARYVLPAYPFICIVAGILLSKIEKIKTLAIPLVLLVWLIVSVFVNYPHTIAYTNELIRTQARFEYFSDSNLDWGQSLITLKQYVDENKISAFELSYFGRDNVLEYGLESKPNWGSYKNDEICEFHKIGDQNLPVELTAISVSNRYNCGYYQNPTYAKNRISETVGESILLFK